MDCCGVDTCIVENRGVRETEGRRWWWKEVEEAEMEEEEEEVGLTRHL